MSVQTGVAGGAADAGAVEAPSGAGGAVDARAGVALAVASVAAAVELGLAVVGVAAARSPSSLAQLAASQTMVTTPRASGTLTRSMSTRGHSLAQRRSRRR